MPMNVFVCGCATRGCLCECPMCAPVCGAFERLCMWHVCVGVRCNCVLRAAGGRGSFGSASGRAVRTQLIVRKKLGRDKEEKPLASLTKAQFCPCGPSQQQGLRSCGSPPGRLSPANSGRHPLSCPTQRRPGARQPGSFRAAAAAALEETRGDSEVCM